MELFNLLGVTQLLYIDPAATSVLLTSLTAIVVAIGASAIIIWRKFKKKLDKALKKDPNANKEVEDELVITDDETQSEATAEPAETAETETSAEAAADGEGATAQEEGESPSDAE